MHSSHDRFYEQLQGFSSFENFPQSSWYVSLPREWLVAIADVLSSTRAINEGRYRDVNGVGVASIAAVLNAVKPLAIPYVFGGDGATCCIPPSQKHAVEAALVATKRMAAGSFGLALRIGMVPVSRIQGDGFQILIGTYQPSLRPAFQ